MLILQKRGMGIKFMRNNFAVFICTHGRPNKQLTLNTLRRCGYTGKVYLVLDDTDKTIQQYIDNYDANDIIVFDKNHYINNCYDTGDNVGHYKCILYAKMAVEDMAKEFGLSSFMLVDDDITNFRYRYPKENKCASVKIKNMDDALDIYIDFLLENNITALGFGSPSTYFSGARSFEPDEFLRYRGVFQVYIRNTNIPVTWINWYGEDNITLLKSSTAGNLWLQIPYIEYECVLVGDTSKDGGMVDIYKSVDSFELNFNIKRYFPGSINLMLYHKTNKWLPTWKGKKCFPFILSQVHRKEE